VTWDQSIITYLPLQPFQAQYLHIQSETKTLQLKEIVKIVIRGSRRTNSAGLYVGSLTKRCEAAALESTDLVRDNLFHSLLGKVMQRPLRGGGNVLR